VPKEKLEYRGARDALILRLFLSGMSYRQIGRHPRVRLSPKGVGNVVSPLAAMFGLPEQLELEVLSDSNAATYWDRSDHFDLALDLTVGRRGLDFVEEQRWSERDDGGIELVIVELGELSVRIDERWRERERDMGAGPHGAVDELGAVGGILAQQLDRQLRRRMVVDVDPHPSPLEHDPAAGDVERDAGQPAGRVGHQV